MCDLREHIFFYRRALQDEMEVSDDEQQSQEISATENVVRLRVFKDDFKPMMFPSMQELPRAGLKIDCFGLRNNEQETASTTPSCMPQKPLSCAITVLYHDSDAAIKKLPFIAFTEETSIRKWPNLSLPSYSSVR